MATKKGENDEVVLDTANNSVDGATAAAGIVNTVLELSGSETGGALESAALLAESGADENTALSATTDERAVDAGKKTPTQAKGYRVHAKLPSYHAIKRHFTAEPVTFSAGELTPAQVADLRADPWIHIDEITG
jgi:hypothetical protein